MLRKSILTVGDGGGRARRGDGEGEGEGEGKGRGEERDGEREKRLENLHQDIKFINNLLSQLGLEAPFPFSRVVITSTSTTATDSSASTADLYNLESAVKILISLLNSKQRENAFRTELEGRQRRLTEELDSREIIISKFHGKLEASERELCTIQQQLREAQGRLGKLEGIIQGTTEESNRLKNAFAVKEKQFHNELRKRGRDFEKLKEQLQHCLKEPAAIINLQVRTENLVDKSFLSKPSSSLLLLSDERQRSTTTTSFSPSMMESDDEREGGFDYKRVGSHSNTIDAHSESDRLELLEHENANMRQLMGSVSQILAEMRQTLALKNIYNHQEMEESKDLSEQISTLPVSWIYDQVKDEIETSLAVISDFLRSQ